MDEIKIKDENLSDDNEKDKDLLLSEVKEEELSAVHEYLQISDCEMESDHDDPNWFPVTEESITDNMMNYNPYHTNMETIRDCSVALTQLESHSTSELIETIYKCKKYKNVYYIEKNVKMKHGAEVYETIYQCSWCTFTSHREHALQNHIHTHEIERSFSCESNSNNFRILTGEKPCQCPYCDYAAGNNSHLKQHIRIHTGEKPYQCPYCDHATGQISSLIRHLQTHTGEKPHRCPYCDYAAARNFCLQRHLRTHTGEKPYQCPHCDYAAGDNSHLQQHIRTHTKKRPYQCPYCDYAGKQNSHLRQHLRTHTGEKPFQCPHCDHAVGQKSSLMRHLRTHT